MNAEKGFTTEDTGGHRGLQQSDCRLQECPFNLGFLLNTVGELGICPARMIK